jgi:hypothetical protein
MLQISILLHVLIIGFMIFFMTVITPSVFNTLNEDAAGKFLRFVFPRMFLYGFILSFFSFVTALTSGDVKFYIVPFISGLFFFFNAYAITPKINLYRDKFKGGELIFEKKFKQFHFISVFIFLGQLLSSISLVVLYFT